MSWSFVGNVVADSDEALAAVSDVTKVWMIEVPFDLALLFG